MTSRSPIVPTLLALGLLIPSAPAQEALQVEADIEFAEGLARRWQFVDLAEQVLDDIAREHKLTPAQKESLGLTRCEVFATAARRERDPEKRGGLYESALQSYRDFIADNEYSEVKPSAELALVQLSNTFASTLEMQLDDLVGDPATAMREKIRILLEGPLTRTGKLVGDLAEIAAPTESDKRDRAALMLDRGRMLSTMGRVSEDGTFYFAQAESVLENLALEFGERSGYGLQSYLEMARIKGARGNWDEAMIFFQFVVDAVMPPDPTAWEEWSTELSQSDKEQYWKFAELSIPGLLEAAVNNNDPQTATTYALLFWNRYKSEGFSLSLPRGYMALLSAARTLLDTGGYIGGRTTSGKLRWFATREAMTAESPAKANQRSAVDMALLMAQTVGQDNKGNTLQVRAQKVISVIIDQPGIVLGPEMLFQAAQGQYKDKDYLAAVLGCKRTLASLDEQDDATRSEFGPKVLNKLGKSYANLQRYLEATMVFREAVTTWGGDPQYDNQNAKGMLAAVQLLKGRTNNDKLINGLFLEAENHVTRTTSDGDTGDIVFRQSMRLYEAKNYDAAFDKFSEIQPSSNSYEKALVYRGACRHRQKRYDEAAPLFTAYLEEYLTDPKNQTTSESRLARRHEARALATFYIGSIAYKKKDWPRVLAYFSRFDKQFPGQSQMVPNAIYMAIQADLNLSKIDDARDLLVIMLSDYPAHKYTGSASRGIYAKVSKQQKAAPPDSAQSKALLRTAAELITTANRISAKPSYADLRLEATHWVELGAWPEAERGLRQTVKLYADSKVAKERSGCFKNVSPELGRVLIAQSKLPEALEVLRPLIPPVKPPEGTDPPEFRPYSSTVHAFFKVAVGWVEGNLASNTAEVLGVGTPEDVVLAAEWMESLSRSSKAPKYEPNWYQIKFNLIFAWRRVGQSNKSKLQAAKQQLATMRTDCGDSFEGIAEDFIKNQPEDPDKAKKDGETLRQHYLWLGRELN